MRGRILFNGNAGDELIAVIAPELKGRDGGAPKVLLITAAWEQREGDDAGQRTQLQRAGLTAPAGNLGAWSAWREFLDRRPDLSAAHAELAQVGEELRHFYLQRTGFHAELIRKGVATARDRVKGFSLGRVHDRDPVQPQAALPAAELLQRALGRELVHSIEALVQNDARMLRSLEEADDQLHTRTGLRMDAGWREARATLEQKILSADALVFFGGNPTALLEPLRFFDLRPALVESLRRGATLVATSAGALVMCERMIVYDNFAGDPLHRDFWLMDRGLGLVNGLQILPHCMDRIQTDDADNLAYLARRFGTRICAGLNAGSYLLVEMAGPSAVSIGEQDGVYVFGADGIKSCFRKGEAIPL